MLKKSKKKVLYTDEYLIDILTHDPEPIPFDPNPPVFKTLNKCSIHKIPGGVAKIGTKMSLPAKNIHLNGTVKTVGVEFCQPIASAEDLFKIVKWIQPCHLGRIEDEKGYLYRSRQFIHQAGQCWFINSTLMNHIDTRFRVASLLKNSKNYDYDVICFFHNRRPNGTPFIYDDVYYKFKKLGANDAVTKQNEFVKHTLKKFEEKRKRVRDALSSSSSSSSSGSSSSPALVLSATSSALLSQYQSVLATASALPSSLTSSNASGDDSEDANSDDERTEKSSMTSISSLLNLSNREVGGIVGTGPTSTAFSSRHPSSLSFPSDDTNKSVASTALISLPGVGVGAGAGSGATVPSPSSLQVASLDTSFQQASTLFTWILKNTNTNIQPEKIDSFHKMMNVFEKTRPRIMDGLEKSADIILQMAQQFPESIPTLMEPFVQMQNTHEIEKALGERSWYTCVMMYILYTQGFKQIKQTNFNPSLFSQQVEHAISIREPTVPL